jgi:hypothetical protein
MFVNYRAVFVIQQTNPVIMFDWKCKFPLIKSFVSIYICNEINKRLL